MEKRENKIGVRVSDSEKAKIEEKAKKESMELSDVVRQIKRGLILQIKTDFFNRLAMV